jgi:hypothetical protein
MLLSGNLLFFEQDFMLRLLSLLQKCSELHGQFLSDGLQGIIFAAGNYHRIVSRRNYILLSIAATHLSC